VKVLYEIKTYNIIPNVYIVRIIYIRIHCCTESRRVETPGPPPGYIAIYVVRGDFVENSSRDEL